MLGQAWGVCPWQHAGYMLEHKLGSGSFSTVWAGRSLAGDEAAVKVLDKSLEGNRKDVIASEIKVLRQLARSLPQHPGLVQLHGVYEDTRNVYLVTELLSGAQLAQLLRDRGQLDEASVCSVIRQLAQAVYDLHRIGVIHRDLKLENVLFQQASLASNVKLIDFGLSTTLRDLSEAATDDAAPVEVMGSEHFIAPEVLREQHYSPACDIWALGAIAYNLLCGSPPFPNDLATLDAPLAFDQPVWEGVSEDAKDLISKLLRKSPNQRPSAMQVLRHPWLRSSAQPLALSHVPSPLLRRPPTHLGLPPSPLQLHAWQASQMQQLQCKAGGKEPPEVRKHRHHHHHSHNHHEQHQHQQAHSNSGSNMNQDQEQDHQQQQQQGASSIPSSPLSSHREDQRDWAQQAEMLGLLNSVQRRAFLEQQQQYWQQQLHRLRRHQWDDPGQQQLLQEQEERPVPGAAQEAERRQGEDGRLGAFSGGDVQQEACARAEAWQEHLHLWNAPQRPHQQTQQEAVVARQDQAGQAEPPGSLTSGAESSCTAGQCSETQPQQQLAIAGEEGALAAVLTGSAAGAAADDDADPAAHTAEQAMQPGQQPRPQTLKEGCALDGAVMLQDLPGSCKLQSSMSHLNLDAPLHGKPYALSCSQGGAGASGGVPSQPDQLPQPAAQELPAGAGSREHGSLASSPRQEEGHHRVARSRQDQEQEEKEQQQLQEDQERLQDQEQVHGGGLQAEAHCESQDPEARCVELLLLPPAASLLPSPPSGAPPAGAPAAVMGNAASHIDAGLGSAGDASTWPAWPLTAKAASFHGEASRRWFCFWGSCPDLQQKHDGAGELLQAGLVASSPRVSQSAVEGVWAAGGPSLGPPAWGEGAGQGSQSQDTHSPWRKHQAGAADLEWPARCEHGYHASAEGGYWHLQPGAGHVAVAVPCVSGVQQRAESPDVLRRHTKQRQQQA